MWDMLFWLLILAFIAIIIVIGGLAARSYMTGQSPAAAFFGPKPDPRIYVTEQASVDGRRRLLLIRRDNVEHLIMTGGPVDVVIETGIQEPAQTQADRHAAHTLSAPVQVARTFGQRATGSDG